jgi:hypothetical protein
MRRFRDGVIYHNGNRERTVGRKLEDLMPAPPELLPFCLRLDKSEAIADAAIRYSGFAATPF